jgi:hypothetical protein
MEYFAIKNLQVLALRRLGFLSLSTADFRFEPPGFQFSDQSLPMIALNYDNTIFYRSASPAAPL